MTILLIEDDHRLAELIQLKLSDHEVIMAHTLSAAKLALESIRTHLILVDLNLPDSRGLETLIALKGYLTPKVVLSSSLGAIEQEAAAHGAIDYVKKSRGIDDIVARIRFNLSKCRPRRMLCPDQFKQIQACLAREPVAV